MLTPSSIVAPRWPLPFANSFLCHCSLTLCLNFLILIRVTARGVVMACRMVFLEKYGGCRQLGEEWVAFIYTRLVQLSVPSMLYVFLMHAFHFHSGKKKVRFLSNVAAFVMSPYPNASINPVSALCGISVVGLSLHMTLRTDRWKVS